MRREILGAAAAVGLIALDVAAQDAVLLRYRPPVQAMLRIVSSTEMAAALAPRDPAADSVTFRVRVQQSFTERVLQAGDRYLVERHLDSVRVGFSTAGAAANERVSVRPQRALVLLTDRLETLGVEMQGGDAAPATMLRSPSGGFEITLPADPVRPGQRWTAAVRFPFAIPSSGDDGPGSFSLDTVLTSTATFILDSLVARGRDTLAYLGAWGRFDPFATGIELEGGGGSRSVTGGFRGVVIWSTAWNAFGSGALRADVTVQFTSGDDEGTGADTMTFDMVNRFEIRP